MLHVPDEVIRPVIPVPAASVLYGCSLFPPVTQLSHEVRIECRWRRERRCGNGSSAEDGTRSGRVMIAGNEIVCAAVLRRCREGLYKCSRSIQ